MMVRALLLKQRGRTPQLRRVLGERRQSVPARPAHGLPQPLHGAPARLGLTDQGERLLADRADQRRRPSPRLLAGLAADPEAVAAGRYAAAVGVAAVELDAAGGAVGTERTTRHGLDAIRRRKGPGEKLASDVDLWHPDGEVRLWCTAGAYGVAYSPYPGSSCEALPPQQSKTWDGACCQHGQTPLPHLWSSGRC